ncbi:S8 family serine peptidase [Paraburkholderia sp. Tr-20389]|uniref:S8 family serine peptidase n=1 Tax=Paraburkholderia sp. Tr-20389 TaxID=2703903 RepID=UPI0019811792|nr:S8 family serine peptidase [Paraburkholderia sp. Tr-20389]MBN3751912.1 S8 family serine peptidase [Paraburkholderia sp. Tr-20389]
MTWQSLTGTGGAWSGVDWTGRAADTASADPYFAWADATQFADLGGPPAGWIRVIIELESTEPNGTALTAKSFAESLEGAHAAWKAWIQVSSLYRYPPADLAQTHFLTAVVTKAFFTQLDTTLKGFVKRFELGMPVVPDDAPATSTLPDAGTLAAGTGPAFGPVASASAPPVAGANTGSGQMTFLGVMDDGLAFAHERFRSTATPSTTRIERFWNQDDAAGMPPALHYGREFTKADIDALLARCTQAGQVDEDAVYAQAGYINVRRRWAHGTEVMDLAGGLRPNPLHAASMSPDEREQRDALEQVRVLGVQFRTAGRTVRDTTGRWFAVHALDAMRYILRCADDLADGAKYCVVLNLSYGYMAGSHDGSSIIESAIDELIAMHHDLSVVVPAGNSNMLRCHASFSVENGTSHDITWRALPDCATPGFLEIWLPDHADASTVTVRIHPPWGDPSPPIAVKNMAAWQNGRDLLCTVVYLDRVATGQRSMILIALAPTVTLQPARIAAPAGNWVVTLANLASTSGSLDIHAWIQRNETAYGFPIRGRQSRFDDPRYKRFFGGMHVRDTDDNNTDSWINRRSTLNSIATGDSTVVVGGYRRTDGTAAKYSSTGPSLGVTVRVGPDATAISEDSPACAGVLGASTRSGSLAAISGTSAAAPQVARAIACAQVIGKAPVIQPHGMPPFSARTWVDQRAQVVDPVPASAASMANQLGTCPGTAKPPVLPLPAHAWVPRLPAPRGGFGRFPSPRWKKRGVKL